MKALEAVKKRAQNSVEELKNFDWNDLGDIETIGVWPGVVKLLLSAVVFSGCLGGGYWFHIKNLQAALAVVEAEEITLRTEMEGKATLAANLEAYRQQMVDMEETFGDLLNRLPGETEVPGLLDDITFTGLGSGLEFTYFEPQSENEQEFYFELPISIQVSGGYHDFGTFVSSVASLDRIVTLHDFNISAGNNSSDLTMSITAKTYRYNVDE
jgi:type IV pilus assembly protein PilO